MQPVYVCEELEEILKGGKQLAPQMGLAPCRVAEITTSFELHRVGGGSFGDVYLGEPLAR